ncbi:hypothetical protein L1987_07031 [Smallanthus sonchifolius]|uniref:Uncharacterized protein n=1 Tax=Smallanthus sonchifolius TaxID=185202 RepID=A0ACB9JZQ1_9ASTR|nr:hypothetical protein L1987_07031 [Smallanthus sonchifolius]
MLIPERKKDKKFRVSNSKLKKSLVGSGPMNLANSQAPLKSPISGLNKDKVKKSVMKMFSSILGCDSFAWGFRVGVSGHGGVRQQQWYSRAAVSDDDSGWGRAWDEVVTGWTGGRLP